MHIERNAHEYICPNNNIYPDSKLHGYDLLPNQDKARQINTYISTIKTLKHLFHFGFAHVHVHVHPSHRKIVFTNFWNGNLWLLRSVFAVLQNSWFKRAWIDLIKSFAHFPWSRQCEDGPEPVDNFVNNHFTNTCSTIASVRCRTVDNSWPHLKFVQHSMTWCETFQGIYWR